MRKRLFSLILAFVMALGMIPGAAFAADQTSNPDTAYLSMSDDGVFLPDELGGAAGLKQTASVDAYWPNFRGSDSNMAVVNAKTPVSAETTELKWNVKLGSGWAAAPSPMIIVDNAMVVMVGSNIYKLNLEDGSVLAQGKMVSSIGFGIVIPTYGDGMIFCPLSNGRVQAFDARTLESLWVFQDELKGQPNCPITYADGMIYTGFWNSETKNANYVAIDARDDDPSRTNEAKTAAWTKTAKGGYYWVGSVVVGDAVIFGTDDGAAGTEGTGAHLYALNRKTGEIITDLTGVLTGDQRSSIAYSAEKGRIYFTTKGGYLYSAAVDAQTGALSDLKSSRLNSNQSTSTPVVYGDQVYLCCGAGVGGYGSNNFTVVDADTLEELYSVPVKAYPQCSPLVSTAYMETEGKLYIYLTYNGQPGGITLIKVDPARTTAASAELIELYDAKGFEQYCICSIICDENGTLYYKNDSCNILAVGSKAVDAAVEQVIRAIDQIGTVTLESGDAIAAARAAYEALTAGQQVQVTNLETLKAAEAKLAELKKPAAVDAYWPNFRGSDDNMAIVSVRTPAVPDNTELKWNVKLGTGWAAAPSPMIIVDHAMVVMVKDKLYKLSLEDGSVLAESKMAASIGFGIVSPTYGDGMIFCPLSYGRVQAFDAKTLEPLWVFQDTLKGQADSPITYADGMLYTGFWNSETRDANYVAIDVRDEDPAKPDEKKTAVWTKTAKGGYYWAGAVVVGDAVIFGTDDGANGFAGKGAHLYALNRKTGEVITDLTGVFIGDQRSSIAYSAEKGRIYFTTKGGYLYSAAADARSGALSDLKGRKLPSEQSTSTPVVYGSKVYLCCGTGVGGGGYNGFVVADADTLEVYYTIPMKDYPQCSPLLSTAYMSSEGRLYFYLTYNNNPGGITLIRVDPAKTTADGAELVELYDAKGFEQYCICSIICDENGTLYYKNDSCNILAVGRKNVNTTVEQVIRAIDEIGTVTLESRANIEAARAAYDALAPENQAQVDNYAVLTAAEARLAELQKAFDQSAAEAVDDMIDAIGTVTLKSEHDIIEARKAYDGLTDDQQKLVTKYDVLSAAEKKLYDLKHPTGDNITVTFRLIGAKQAKEDVDYGTGVTTASAKADYETWIKTGNYTLPRGSKVYDVFMMATREAGLRSMGADRNYVATIYAPSVCGGYELSEFTNGPRSGWMYTLNGNHPHWGLCEQVIENGDDIVWHYINDYAYEVKDWFNDPNFPAQGDSSTWVDWDAIPDVDPGSGDDSDGNASGKRPGHYKDNITKINPGVKPDKNGSARAVVSEEDMTKAVESVKRDGTEEILIEPVVKGDASKITVELPLASMELMLQETKADLAVWTKLAQVMLSIESMKNLTAGKGKTVTITLESIQDKAGMGAIRVELAVDGKVVDRLADGVTASLPIRRGEIGAVMVQVDGQGRENVLRKSVIVDNAVQAKLPGSADIRPVDKRRTFYDLTGHWGEDAAAFASARGLFQGVTASSFAPDAQMTRSMLSTVLWRLENEPAAGTAGVFSDVAAGQWYTQAVSWAAESKIVNGYNGSFNPNDPITRQQLAAMMFRYAEYLGMDISAEHSLQAYHDAKLVADWAQDAMNWAVSVELIGGKGNGILDPTGNATRAEVAAICHRMVRLMAMQNAQ